MKEGNPPNEKKAEEKDFLEFQFNIYPSTYLSGLESRVAIVFGSIGNLLGHDWDSSILDPTLLVF